MVDPAPSTDPQDQAEAFDEDNFDPAGAEAPSNRFRTFEELPDVPDLTRAAGDGTDAPAALDEVLSAEGVEPAADSRWGEDPPRVTALEGAEGNPARPDEIELVYAGDMTEVRGAQASAAHWESRRLDDDDIEALGYADPDRPDAAPRSKEPDQ